MVIRSAVSFGQHIPRQALRVSVLVPRTVTLRPPGCLSCSMQFPHTPQSGAHRAMAAALLIHSLITLHPASAWCYTSDAAAFAHSFIAAVAMAPRLLHSRPPPCCRPALIIWFPCGAMAVPLAAGAFIRPSFPAPAGGAAWRHPRRLDASVLHMCSTGHRPCHPHRWRYACRRFDFLPRPRYLSCEFNGLLYARRGAHAGFLLDQ
jgi:hypothetical protein